jgi:hypothetical protein
MKATFIVLVCLAVTIVASEMEFEGEETNRGTLPVPKLSKAEIACVKEKAKGNKAIAGAATKCGRKYGSLTIGSGVPCVKAIPQLKACFVAL